MKIRNDRLFEFQRAYEAAAADGTAGASDQIAALMLDYQRSEGRWAGFSKIGFKK